MSSLKPSSWLQHQFDQRKERNPSYSLRAFARDLNIGQGRVSEYLNSKRRITPNVAERICANLGIQGPDEYDFLNLVQSHEQESKSIDQFFRMKDRTQKKRVLGETEFSHIKDPLYGALISLTELDHFVSNYDWIAKKLNVEKQIVINAIEKLLELKLLRINSKGKLVASDKGLKTASKTPSSAIREHHRRKIELALKSIDQVDITQRDISSRTFAIDSSKLPDAQKIIEEFRGRMESLLSSGKKDSIYHLNVQLVPGSKL